MEHSTNHSHGHANGHADHGHDAHGHDGHGHDGHGHGGHGHDGHGHDDGELHPHVAPVGVLLGTFATLMVLTVITVAATYVDFGPGNLIIALLIATIKAGVVALFFMHLYYDRPLNMVVFFSSLLFVGLFLWFSMMDTSVNQPDIKSREALTVQQEHEERQRRKEAQQKAQMKLDSKGAPVPAAH